VTNEQSPLMSQLTGVPCLSVFMPTTPNPTTGFAFIMPVDRVIATDIPVEEAMKFILSAGAVAPMGGDRPLTRRGLDLEDLFRDRKT
jgi:uncharacterized membrane protein